MTEIDESRLEQLIGVHSSKTGYYAQWRGTRRDLERALAGLRAMSDALCVTYQSRFGADDPYMLGIRRQWGEGLRKVFDSIEPPSLWTGAVKLERRGSF